MIYIEEREWFSETINIHVVSINHHLSFYDINIAISSLKFDLLRQSIDMWKNILASNKI